MRDHAVVIAGGGPTGLMLAAELTLAGVDVAIVERRATQDLVGARAGGLHSRTIEVFDQRGIADRFLAEGQIHQMALGYHHTPLNISDLPSRHNYFLVLWQQNIERILAAWAGELSVPIYRGIEVTALLQHDSSVDVTLSDGASLSAQYLVGCDGGRSIVRKSAGIEFPGYDPTKSWLIAEAQTTAEPAWGLREDATGTHAIAKLEDGKAMRVVLTESQLNIGGEPTLSDVSHALIAVYGTDYGIHTPISISRFTDMARQAASYRKHRVLLAGDAAHVHPPMGGQGLNIGVQDAVNLGWKLAQVVKHTSPQSLLDTYHAERHPIAARVLRDTMAHVALQRTDDRTKALGQTLAELLTSDDVRKRITAEKAGLAIHYNLDEKPEGPEKLDGPERSQKPERHPLVGRRIPDLDLITANGQQRLFTLLHDARPILLNLNQGAPPDITPWANRVKLIDAQYTGAWNLPVIGAVAAPAAILIRPDGHVAWLGDGTAHGLTEALTAWFGPPTAT